MKNKTEKLMIRFSQEDIALIQEAAKNAGNTKAGIARHLILTAIKQNGVE